MALTSIGDMAQTLMLKRQNAQLKGDVQRYSTELTTGRTTDISAKVRGDLTYLSGIDSSLARLESFKSTTAEGGLVAQTMQTALGVIDSLVNEVAPAILNAGMQRSETSLEAATIAASSKFETVISTLNTQIGDRTLFGGTGTSDPALAKPEDILTALETVISGLTTAADVQTALDDWFNLPGGFDTVGYLGQPENAPLMVAPGDSVKIGVTAADPAIRDTLKGLAMTALLQRGALAGDAEERAKLALSAGETLIGTSTSRAYVAAQVGTVEAAIEAASIRNGSEISALQIARNNLVSVDPYDSAVKLETAQTQIETLYAITARMSRMSLLDFLR